MNVILGIQLPQYHDIMMIGSNLITRIVSCFALPQSYPAFAISWSFAPLLAHAGAGHKASPPLASKLAVEQGF